jgi:hypothetical protein
LLDRLAARGAAEWHCVVDDLIDLSLVEVEQDRRRPAMHRTALQHRPDLPRNPTDPATRSTEVITNQASPRSNLKLWCLKRRERHNPPL